MRTIPPAATVFTTAIQTAWNSDLRHACHSAIPHRRRRLSSQVFVRLKTLVLLSK
jgi:hypothetical protein